MGASTGASYVSLDIPDVATASLLLLLDAALSLALRLGLERRLVVAGLRMVVQLSLIGLALRLLFAASSPGWTALAALTMILFAGFEVKARQERRFIGAWTYGLGTGAMLLAAGSVTILALSTQIRPDPWYDPRYLIPLLGMILGNTMSGVSLGLNALVTNTLRDRAAIEARLALGATRWLAMRAEVSTALRSGLMPIINAMSAAGVVSLPGMMTGQILAGIDPVEAIKYQLLIMFLIAGGTGTGALIAVLGGVRLLTDERHRLRLDRVVVNSGRF